ncbi:mitochondrial Homoaconitase [Serendipita sp. 401]|nr:mitochondrial Homoaconitase [Serendipita sp. 401]
MLAPRPYNGSSKILFRIRRFATVSNAKPPQTFIEKVVQRYALGLAPGQTVRAGDYVMIRPEHVMSHDNTGPVISKFKAIGASRIFNPKQAVFTLDHDVQNKTDKNLKKYATIEAFARSHEVDFYPAGRGIGHQILVEEGYAFPQTLTVASDSHSNMYGGVGCVGTPIVRTDAAAIWATGQTWWQVPRMIKVELSGKLSPGVTGKDVIVALCGLFNDDQVLNGAIEFTGDGISALDIDDRLTISNMTTEWGALAGVFPVDEKLLQWYESMLKKTELRTFSSPKIGSAPPPPEHPRLNRKRLNDLSAAVLTSDPDATYSSHLRLDLSTLVPHVSGPNSVKISTPLPDLTAKKIAINKAPAVVAASAVKGYICGPDHLQDQSHFSSQVPGYSITSSSVASSNAARKEQAVISGFPKVFSGRLLFAPQDNLNTDGIYPGKYTYQDDMTLEQQAKVVMENYDPSFAPMVAGLTRDLSTPSANANSKRGVILVSGYNFGTGSSREQAATALKSAGVPLVISGSFGDIFKRNAINNALICMECPELVRDLTEAYTPQQKRGNGGLRGELTVNPGWDIEVEMATGSVVVTTDTGEKRAYSVQPVGPSVQELWTCNGLEGFVLQKLKSEAV